MSKKLLIIASICLMGCLMAGIAFAQVEPTAARHMFTSNIVDREPADTISAFNTDNAGSLFYFSELANMQDSAVKHVWSINDKPVYERTFDVNGARWRVYTSMRAEHFTAGDVVKVEIISNDGTIFATDTLVVE